MAARGGGLGAGLLAEHVVGELAAPVLLDAAHAHRGELDERVARELAHARLGHAEHVRELVVALPLLEHELDDRPLLGESWSKVAMSGRTVVCPPVWTRRFGPIPRRARSTTCSASRCSRRAPERCRARFAVEKRVQQPLGLVHGGAYAALAESMVSATTHVAVEADGNFAVGQSNHTTFLRPVTEGTSTPRARPSTAGRTTWVWDVRFTDDDGRLCAASRVTIAVRPA